MASALRPSFREDQVKIVTSFIRHHLEESGRAGLVVGMSGGIDSSLVAKLCADAVGPQRVLGAWLGEGPPQGEDHRDAADWARALGIHLRAIDIDPFVIAFRDRLEVDPEDKIGLGNIKARVRMIILYDIARRENRLVMGTGNKSEVLLGYFSKMGDGGVDFLPIGDLYKTQVREMAKFLGLPKRLLEKVPTAGLWAGQTDEDELGVTYDVLDRILVGMELRMRPEDIAERAGASLEIVNRVERMHQSSVHKRKVPLIPKIGIRTVGLDWRE